MFTRKPIAGLLILLTFAAAPALAEWEDERWILRAGISWVAPSGSSEFRDQTSEEVEGGEILVSDIERWYGTAAPGLHAEMEFLATRWFGVLLGIQHSNHDINGDIYRGQAFLPTGGQVPDDLQDVDERFATDEFVASLRVFPIYAGANFHVLQDSSFDLYVGVLVAAVTFGDLHFRASPVGEPRPDRNVRSDVSAGGNLGFDWRVGEKLFWFGGIQYIPADAVFETEGEQDTLVIDPWYANLGLGIRW